MVPKGVWYTSTELVGLDTKNQEISCLVQKMASVNISLLTLCLTALRACQRGCPNAVTPTIQLGLSKLWCELVVL